VNTQTHTQADPLHNLIAAIASTHKQQVKHSTCHSSSRSCSTMLLVCIIDQAIVASDHCSNCKNIQVLGLEVPSATAANPKL
jgi:hypothetical protein